MHAPDSLSVYTVYPVVLEKLLSSKLSRRHPAELLKMLGEIRDILKTASGGDIADA